ncbi:MAG: hypothetical protein CMJ18_22065 [Phycisphaeraceae bacterium]|nr:hypothetical protein [Phycisphaeraceae bacterium]
MVIRCFGLGFRRVSAPFVVAVFAIAATPTFAAPPSFTDHGGAELSVDGPVFAPINHEPNYVTERELFGYNPRFVPSAVSFGPDNEPYIWRGTYLITLNRDGRWIVLDTSKAIREKYDDIADNGHVAAYDPHLAFDVAGDAYMVARLGPMRSDPNEFKYGMLHSTDRCRTWTFYETPNRPERLERREAHNPLPGPPPLVEGRGRELNLVTFRKKGDGTLTNARLTVVAKVIPPVVRKGRHWITPAHSGCGNVTATIGSRTHVVWFSIQPLSFHREAAEKLPTEMQGPYVPYALRFKDDGLEALAPAYAATFDHETGQVTEPIIIGFTRRDRHNGPVISVDSKGYLHVIIGAHGDNFLYTKSLKPNSTTDGWTEPYMFGTPNPPRGGGSYTYTGTVMDGDDTLHLVSRFSGSGNHFRLTYNRKPIDGAWSSNFYLVNPGRVDYSVWYHQVNMDRRGRLFVNYWKYVARLRPGEIEAYRRKYPDDDYRKENGREVGLRRHDPCMLISEDQGQTWRIAVTEDFR